MNKNRRFYINIWDSCNLECRHCFNFGGRTEGILLTVPEITRVIEEAKDFLGITEVQLTGGEPTQRPEILAIISNLFERGLNVLVQTNGVFNSQLREQFLKLPEDRLVFIISLDGIETNDYFRGQGVTAKVIDNIKILSRKFRIRINTLLSSKIKWDEVEKLARIANRPGLTLAFNPVCPEGRANSHLLMPPGQYFEWMHKLEEIRERGVRVRKCFDFNNGHMTETEECPVRKGSAIFVAADGSVYPCGFLANNPLLYSGSVRDFSIAESTGKIPTSCKTVPKECLHCEFYTKGYCHAGCPARIYAINGTFDKADVYCMAKYLEGSIKR